jgi:oxidase EvaA
MSHVEQRRAAEASFLKSALTVENRFNSTGQVLDWLHERNQAVRVSIERIPFAAMRNWQFDAGISKLHHSSGGFFSIEAINVRTNWGEVQDWDQPIINQPEIGLLGILAKEFDGTLYFLMQAKIEPGNVNNVQLSPTLQATKSNYTRLHKGKTPAYLEYFLDKARGEVLLDQLQSEQGARFLMKRNRNIIVRTQEDVVPGDDFRWLTLGQLKDLMRTDNIVNMDTRTVISGIAFGDRGSGHLERFAPQISTAGARFLASDLEDGEATLHSLDHVIRWFADLKSRYDLRRKPVPLHAARNWIMTADCIKHAEGRFFRVIAARVEIGNREVTSWDQPLLEPVQQGICAFIARDIGGVLHFLVQAKVEPGNFDVVEMAPTLQCVTGSYSSEHSLKTLPYLEYVLKADRSIRWSDALQSEEGGRFYREQNRNIILLVGNEFPVAAPDNYIWMTLNQLKTFIKFNNYVNIQARNLIATVSYR